MSIDSSERRTDQTSTTPTGAGETTTDDPGPVRPPPEVTPTRPRTTPAPPRTPRVPASAAGALTRLADLPVIERHPADIPDYSRDAFGSRWADVDGNGCNQRDDVLLRDALPGTVRVQPQRACSHDVLAGTWIDPYTGRRMTFTDLKDRVQAQAIQIDHIVPLSEAWISGAHGWSPERRREYANDLDNLLAVDGPTNAAKRSDDPAAWRPRKGYQCAYATRWIAVKHRWRLGVDRSEATALRDMLGRCAPAAQAPSSSPR